MNAKPRRNGVAYKIQDHAWVLIQQIGPHKWKCPSKWLGGGTGTTPEEAAYNAMCGGIPRWAFCRTRKEISALAAARIE